MKRVLGLAALALLAPAATAHAAPPKRVAGVQLSWPAKTVVTPGQQVTLGVRSQGRKARVALLAGTKVLARRTLRNGTFRATVPAGGGKRYTLRATVAGRRYTQSLTTAACDGTAGTLKTDGTTGRPGGRLEVTFTNTGKRCLQVPSGPWLSWLRADGSAVDIDVDGNVRRPDDWRIAALAPPVELAPGASHTLVGHVPERLTDGTYTLRWKDLSPTTFRVDACVGASGPATAALQLGATTVRAGGALPYSVVNTGTGCLLTGIGYSLARREPDGTFVAVNALRAFPSIGLRVGPGQSLPVSAEIPADAAPGIYRLTHEQLSALFEVTAP